MVTVIAIVIGAFGTIPKGLLKGLEDIEIWGQVETIQTTAIWWSARIPRRFLETWRDFSLKFQRKQLANASVKKLTKDYNTNTTTTTSSTTTTTTTNNNKKEYLRRTRKLLKTKLHSLTS